MTEIRKAVQFPHVYGKQPDFVILAQILWDVLMSHLS